MTGLSALWLRILVSSVIVFVASSLIHMVLPWHKSDYPKLPNEDRVRDALRPLAIPPGDYFIPRPSDSRSASPEFAEKMRQGPVVIFTVKPNGPMSMQRNLVMWFVYILVVGLFAAYVAGARCRPARRTFACSSSSAPPRSSGTRSRFGKCRSGIAARGAPRSSRASTG
jgi:hypothetical protein